MIVDDQRALGEVLAERLAFDGYQTEVVATAGEAIRLGQDGDFDVAFVDFRLPDRNGAELAAILKQQRPQLKVVLMTGFATTLNELRSDWHQFDAVLPKPWKPAELDAVLKSLAGNRRCDG